MISIHCRADEPGFNSPPLSMEVTRQARWNRKALRIDGSVTPLILRLGLFVCQACLALSSLGPFLPATFNPPQSADALLAGLAAKSLPPARARFSVSPLPGRASHAHLGYRPHDEQRRGLHVHHRVVPCRRIGTLLCDQRQPKESSGSSG